MKNFHCILFFFTLVPFITSAQIEFYDYPFVKSSIVCPAFAGHDNSLYLSLHPNKNDVTSFDSYFIEFNKRLDSYNSGISLSFMRKNFEGYDYRSLPAYDYQSASLTYIYSLFIASNIVVRPALSYEYADLKWLSEKNIGYVNSNISILLMTKKLKIGLTGFNLLPANISEDTITSLQLPATGSYLFSYTYECRNNIRKKFDEYLIFSMRYKGKIHFDDEIIETGDYRKYDNSYFEVSSLFDKEIFNFGVAFRNYKYLYYDSKVVQKRDISSLIGTIGYTPKQSSVFITYEQFLKHNTLIPYTKSMSNNAINLSYMYNF